MRSLKCIVTEIPNIGTYYYNLVTYLQYFNILNMGIMWVMVRYYVWVQSKSWGQNKINVYMSNFLIKKNNQ